MAMIINIGLMINIGNSVNLKVKNHILWDTIFIAVNDTKTPITTDNKIVIPAYVKPSIANIVLNCLSVIPTLCNIANSPFLANTLVTIALKKFTIPINAMIVPKAPPIITKVLFISEKASKYV